MKVHFVRGLVVVVKVVFSGNQERKLYFCKSLTTGRPLKGRNILGCSGAISLHLHFRVCPGINRFHINETGFETGFQGKVLKKSRTFRLKPVSDSCKLVLKLVYTVKYSEMQPPRNDGGTSWNVPTLERATQSLKARK